ncbi:MAG: hypothetical protein GX620_08285 [Chloroflexi bacterium]|nr:hypothetical protein [Chloroflexota bacterium]
MLNKRDVFVKGVFHARFAVMLFLWVFVIALSVSGPLIQPVDVGYVLGALPADEEPYDVFVYLPLVVRNFPVTPAAPTLYAISNPEGLGDYAVSWSASPGATTYTLQEADNAGFASPTTAYAGAATSTDISGRFPGTYYYRVRASNATADSDWSNVEATQVTASPGCPATGTWSGLTSQGGESRIGFDVTDVPYCRIPESELLAGRFGIAIRFWDSCGDERNLVNLNEIPIENGLFDFTFGDGSGHIRGQFTSQTTASGTFYSNKDGCSASGTWTAELLPPGPFGKDGPADGATGRPPSLTLSWEASAGAASYEVCYDTTDDNVCADWVNTGTTREAEISGLLPSTTYYWQVRAVHQFGGTSYADGDSTAYWSFTTGSVPGDFGKANPADGATEVTDSNLEWGASSGAAYYEYCYDTDDDDACAAWTSTGVVTQAQISGLDPATTYYWQVRAVSSFGTIYADGGSGAYWSFTTGSAPGAFAKISPADGADDLGLSVTLEWGDSLGATSYEYCYAVTADCTDWVSTGLMTQVTVSGLISGTTYHWQARAVNQMGTAYADDDSASRWAFTAGRREGADAPVWALAIQSDDNKILVGGWFTELRGQPRAYIGRLNANGALDVDFDPGADDLVRALAVQSDGKILVGGAFTELGGQPRSNIGRLNADGSLDTTFNPGADGSVSALAIQADGKVLVGGDFTELGGQPRSSIGRLNADGSLDTTFNPGADGSVSALAIQADGKILVGGYFTELGGQPRSNIGRLNADGSLDTTFNPGADGDHADVTALAIQADGKIVVGGLFDELGGAPRNNIGRLNADGSPDLDFDPGASLWPYSLVEQPDGKLLVGGMFSTLGGETRRYIGRLNANGSLDTAFNPGAKDYVLALALQEGGEIVVGGLFTELGGQPCDFIGRLSPDGAFMD